MEYKDIKTADELESWYAEKQAVLDSHARDYMVPFGFVYHLDCSGYVSFERWNDTLPTAEEQTAFQAIQNGVSTKEIIEHKDEFGWTDRACRDAEEYDLAPCFIVPARKEYMQEQEIMNVRELYPELIGPDGEIIWSDPDFAKQRNEEAAGPDNFPGHELNDHKNPDQSWISVIPVQMYWKDDPSEEDFVITGVGAGHYVGTCKKEPSKNKSVSEKTCNARESSGRLDADRNVDRNDIAKDKEVK